MSENNDYSYLLDIIKLAESSEEKADSEKFNLKYQGNFSKNTSVSRVNQGLSYIFLKDSSYNTSIISNETSVNKLISTHLNKPIDQVDFILSHNEQPFFRLPDSGHWIVMQNWSFGSIPINWIESICDYVDQLWVSSSYEQDCFIQNGIPKEKIRVINSGIDSLYFNYHINPINVNTKKKKKFLFKGDLNWQSGFDILLKAYTDEFVNDEDICLIIVADAKNVSNEYNQKIKELTNLAYSPEILLIDWSDNEDAASLYKACDFIVYPHRAESYCLNLIESMACGTPAIVTNYGAALDYCDINNSILIKASKSYQSDKKIGSDETIDFPYWADIDTIDLRVTLRKAYQIDQDIYDNLSKNASKSILDKYTWVKINDIIKDNLNELKSKPIKRDLQKDFNNKVLEGLQALTNGKFDESLKVLQEAFDIDPKNANLNFYLANIMMTKSDLPKALSFIITSLNIDANNEDYTNLLGIILYKMSYYDLAQRVFEKIVYLMPEHTGAKESLKVIDLMTDEQLNNPIKINIDPNTYNFIEQITKNTDTKKTATLSVCILTKNEENSIEKAIRSVKKIADEIIILDTGSVDKTVKLVQDSGVKIFHTKWNDDFAHARNELMSHATMDWVLMLDADECLSESSSEKVKAILTNLDKTKVYLPRIINHIDKNNMDEKQEHYVVRILPNNKDIRYIRAIHEYPIINNDLLESENIREIELIHYGYTNKAVIGKNKVVRNRLILQKMFDQDPTDPLNSFYLAENYKDENNFDKVLYFSENTLNILENKQNVSLRHQYQNIFEMSQINILDALIILDEKEEARSKFELFTNYLAKRPDFWFLYGNLELKSNNDDQAIKYYHQALSLRDQHLFSALDLGSVSWKPLSIISNIYFKKGDLYNSLTYLKRAIKEAPDNIDLYHDLASIYSKTGELDLLENTLKSFISYLNNTSLVNLLETITPIYFEKNSQDKLYILLEDIRKEKCKDSLNEDSITLTEKLIEIYYQILKIESKSSIKYSIACCYSFTEDLDKAETIFTELISLNDLEVDSLHNLASIALNKKNIDKAEQLYQKVLSIDKFHSDTYLSLIKLHVFKKEYLKSDEYLKKLAEIDPDNQQLSTMEFELAKVSGDKKLASDMYAAMLFKDKF